MSNTFIKLQSIGIRKFEFEAKIQFLKKKNKNLVNIDNIHLYFITQTEAQLFQILFVPL